MKKTTSHFPSLPEDMSKISCKRHLMRIPVLVCMLSASLSAHALGLGDITYRSRIGEALRLEIPLKASSGETLDASCISLGAPPANDISDIPWLTQARLEIRQTDRGPLLVVSARPSRHPALMLGIVVKCGVSLRRDYALLLDPPNASENQAFSESHSVEKKEVTQGTKLSSRAPREPSQTWVTGEGESLESVARVLYPKNASARRSFIRKGQKTLRVHSASETLDPGTEIPIPTTLAQRPEPSPEPRADAQEASRRDKTAPLSEEKPKKLIDQPKQKRDRILISEAGEAALQLATTMGQRPEMTEQDRARLRNELQLIAVLDEKNAQHLELKERIRQLEALQARLKAEAGHVEDELKAIQSPPNAENLGAAMSSSPLQVKAEHPISNVSAPQDKPETVRSPWYKGALVPLLLLVLTAGLLALILQQKRRKDLPALAEPELIESNSSELSPTEAIENQTAPAEIDEDLLMEPLSASDIWPETASQERSSKAMEGAIGPLTSAGSNTYLQTESGEEHDSAVELAEIMMSFGRVQGAAQTLSDFIRANPRQAVKPWIKLLEVYRAGKMKMEYDALSAQLNKTFNIKPVPWDEFEVAFRAPETLEDLGHIASRICDNWGQRECQTYLHQLLRDNRQGTRQGFPLVIVDEILLLLSILEDLLGPYRPDSSPEETTDRVSELPANPTRPHAGTSAAPVYHPVFVPPASDASSFDKSLSIMAQTPLGSESVLESTSSTTEPLDFDLIDIDLLTKTLHINLDELTEPPQEEPSK